MKNTYLLSVLALCFSHSSFSKNLHNHIDRLTTGTIKQANLPGPGASLHFDGVDDVVNVGNNITTVLSTKNQLTIEAWVYPTATKGNGAIVGNFSYPTNNGVQQFLLRRDDDNQYAFFLDDSKGGYDEVYSGPNTLVMNTWQHVVAVWDGSGLSIYIDGVLKATQSNVNGPNLLTTTNSIAIGGNAYLQFFEGNIDEVRIWSRALCPSEIIADKNCEVAANAVGLLGNYHFNQGIDNDNNSTVLTLNDSSGNNNHGTLVNFALTGATSNWSLNAGVPSGISCTPYNGISAVSIASQKDVSCYGRSDGSVTLSVTGISPSYLWSPIGGTAATATGLAAGTYTCTVSSACGGSRTQVVTITQPPLIDTTQILNLCAGQSITVGTHTYTATGTYVDTLKAVNTCDSIVTTNLTIQNAVDVSITAVGDTVTANAIGAVYQWIDCTGNTIIPNATNQRFIATTSGLYAVKVTIGACSDTSICQEVIVTGIEEVDAANRVQLYPNPSGGLINMTLQSNQQVVIINSMGQIIYRNNLSIGTHRIDLQQEPAGLYTVQLFGNNKIQHLKWVKE